MQTSKPPTIPGSVNINTISINQNISSGSINSTHNKVGFFGKPAEQQSAQNNTLEEVISALREYGLLKLLKIWIQQGSKLVGTGSVGNSQQGDGVSLSGDGNTLAIGGFDDNGNLGATWIFTRTNGVWTQQGSKLVGTGYVGSNIGQGFALSLSYDGNTLAVGGYNDDGGVGATWVFTRANGVWTQQGSKLVGSGHVGSNVGQGNGVSLTDDGNTLAVGGVSDNNGIGAAWVFTRTAGVWTQQGSKLVGTGRTGLYSAQGNDVSIKGNTLIVGGNTDNNGIGAAWIFTRTAGVWTQQGSKLVGTGYVGSNIGQGYSVSLSSTEDTLVLGGLNDNSGIGASWVFTRTAGVWTQQGSKLVGTGAIGNASQGTGVSINGDGNTFVSGGYNDNGGIGAAWVFVRAAGVWTQKDSKLVGTGRTGLPGQVYDHDSVHISSDGNTISIGGPLDENGLGATWIFYLN